jgi:addiction module RelE/StbE family toxin
VRVRWTRSAVRQLAAIGAYIAESNPQAAWRVEVRLREAVARLAQFPAMGRPGRIAGTRELVVPGTPYIVPYRVSGGHVDILAVFHAAQNRPLK